MNKRPGRVNVTTEAGYCNFCGRPRNLRHEEHQLGNFVRTVVTCETCHRTLSSTMGVATADAPANEEPEVVAETKPEPAKRAPAKKAEPASTKPKAASGRAPLSNKNRSAKSK